jgi:phospho-N-acetylmuramoyl-pentapeptide-transferase
MEQLLAVLLVSFGVTFIAAVPFIDLLYKLKFQRQREAQKDIFGHFTSIVNRLHGWKVGTPNAGGILIILVVIFLSVLFYKIVPGYDIVTKIYGLNWSAFILFFTLLSFGLLGLYDDIRKFYGFKLAGAWGLRIRYKMILQIILALVIGYLLYSEVGLHSVLIPLFDIRLELDSFYIIWAALVIFATTNAVNITDGLDGLATGLMVMALSAFWYLSSVSGLEDVSLFIAVVIGSLLAFLYFNIYPARVWLGDTGALSLGAMLAVIALLTDSSLVLPFIGFVFVLEAASSLIQTISKAVWKRRIFIAAPLHHHFEAKGWDETKVTMRLWLLGSLASFTGILAAII